MRRETFMAKPGTVQKSWRVVDAEGQSLGRLAAEVATVLMGKHRPEYTPHVDSGDYVVVLNAKKVVLTGNKADQKLHRWYTGYPDGLKTQTYGQVRESKPEVLIQQAVKRMLPKNRLGRVMLGNMKVYPGAEHPHADRKLVKLEV
jgi:large subunit ribosomal protein L13